METKLTTVSGFHIFIDKNSNNSCVIEYQIGYGESVQLYMNPTTIQARFQHNASWTIKTITSTT